MLAGINSYVDLKKLDAEIERVQQKLGPEVVRLRYHIGPDTSDVPAMHFRIVITDAASRNENLADVSQKITGTLFKELRPYENWGMRMHFNFRNESEQAKRDSIDLDWV